MARPVLSDADRADVFRGLAHPSRRRILRTLGNGEASAGELMAGLKLSMPALSQHLRVLREAGLVTHHAVGNRRVYRRNVPALRRVRRWLDQCGAA
ncbi:MAG: winged helix-turn-helix transcriptional regulator [Phycisphaeraceae bacterium]|nr:winged helix-turn-helix transcriptional regulator [Phycisphaeraceae bacterium]